MTGRAHATAGGHLFALLEEEHSEQLAAEITSALLTAPEGDILHMLRDRDALDSQVAVEVFVHRVHTSETSILSTFAGSIEHSVEIISAPRLTAHLLRKRTLGIFCS